MIKSSISGQGRIDFMFIIPYPLGIAETCGLSMDNTYALPAA
jgi:hypothetical protein